MPDSPPPPSDPSRDEPERLDSTSIPLTRMQPKRTRGPDYHLPTSFYGEPPPFGGQHPAAQYYGAPHPGYSPYGGYGAPAYGGGYGPPAGPPGGLTPQRIFRILRRKWLPILLVTGLGAAGTFFYLKKATPIFQATSMIEITLRTPRILASSIYEDAGSARRPEEEFSTRLQKLRGSTMRERFIEQYRELYSDAPEPDSTLQELFAQEIELDRMRQTDIVTLSLKHPDAELAVRAVNAYARGAEVEAFRQNKDASDSAVAWLQEQAEAQRKLVGEAEAHLVEYRASNQIDVLESQRKAVEASLMSLNGLQVNVESQMVMLEDISGMLQEAKTDSQRITSLPEEMPGRMEIAEALMGIQEAEATRAALLSRYTEQHPSVIAQDEELALSRSRFSLAVERAERTVAASLALKQQQVDSISKKVEEATTRASDLELEVVKRNSEYNTLSRERDAREMSYNGILKRIEEARLSADENTATVTVLEYAGKPKQPVWPSVRKVLPVGLMLGLICGLGVGYLADLLDDRVVSVADIEEDVGLKVLGVVPRSPRSQRQDMALSSLNSKFGQIPEVFAGVRSLLDSPNLIEKSQVVLMASSAPEEGKTICASNLAIICARSKLKTLLIDFDLRRPRMAKIYNQAVGTGGSEARKHSLLHVLAEADRSHFADLPMPGPCANLDIATSQPSRTHSPADIIGGRSVRDFIDWAREHYDRIIIDSAPLGVISDASVLAGIADCVIIVCRPERTRKRVIRHVIQQFRNVGANVAGLIVNDVDLRKGKFTGDYHYHYHQYAYQQSYETPMQELEEGKTEESP